MSLRVLLADESDTIKKVFQLALQDLNAEIKSVHSGLDVIEVAQSFQPHIIFADVLLQKKNGYDTCREIKQNPNFSKFPVVLMWSSFMELDQEQFKKSRADDQLEKPFDADFLRDLIKKYAPQSQDNPLGQFLNFPKSITAPLGQGKTAPPPPLSESALKEDTSEFNIASFLDEELPGASENSKLRMPNAPQAPPPDVPTKDEAWLSADLSKFKLDLEAPSDNLEKFEALNLGERSVAMEMPNIPDNESAPPTAPAAKPAPPSVIHLAAPVAPATSAPPTPVTKDDEASLGDPVGALDQILHFEGSLSKSSSASRAGTETKTRAGRSTTASPVENTANKKVGTIGLGDDEIEAIIRAHTEEIIKTQISETLSDIIERIVRDELSKILDEEVRLKQDINSDNA